MNLFRIDNSIRIDHLIVPEVDTIDLLFRGRPAPIFQADKQIGVLQPSGHDIIPVIHDIQYKSFKLSWLKNMFSRTRSFISVISLIPEAV